MSVQAPYSIDRDNSTESMLSMWPNKYDMSLSSGRTDLPQYVASEATIHQSEKTTLPTINTSVLITLYSVNFLLAVVGNILVMVTIVQNKRMRTVTNVFLFSLSASDLCLALLCMPFTLVGNVLRNYIFPNSLCKIIVYFQGISVNISTWTMVAISVERYFAICMPLKSRSWQTKRHAYIIIPSIWIAAFLIFIPTVKFTEVVSLVGTTRRCLEQWPSVEFMKTYLTSLFLVLMVIPFLVMALAYGLIILELEKGMRQIRRATMNEKKDGGTKLATFTPLKEQQQKDGKPKDWKRAPSCAPRNTSSNAAKKRVVIMLIIIVALFFVCWTPSWILNIWYIHHPSSAIVMLNPLYISIARLLTYISSCTNPIVYCFLNKGFRQGFLEAFGCCVGRRHRHTPSVRNINIRSNTTNINNKQPATSVYTNVSSDSD